MFYPGLSVICVLLVSFAEWVGRAWQLLQPHSGFSAVLLQFPANASGRVVLSLWTNDCVHFALDAFVIGKDDLAKPAALSLRSNRVYLHFTNILVILSSF